MINETNPEIILHTWCKQNKLAIWKNKDNFDIKLDSCLLTLTYTHIQEDWRQYKETNFTICVRELLILKDIQMYMPTAWLNITWLYHKCIDCWDEAEQWRRQDSFWERISVTYISASGIKCQTSRRTLGRWNKKSYLLKLNIKKNPMEMMMNLIYNKRLLTQSTIRSQI